MSKLNNPLCTVVVTVIEGRYFPQNPNGKLYIECRFTDEILSTISPDSNSILSTDSVEQVSFPIWNTELAWEVDQQTLRLLRTKWAHLKLQCFSVDNTKGNECNNREELIGYSMLDLRMASDRSGKEKWISLNNTKVKGKVSPEIKISFCILPNLSSSVTSPICNIGYTPSPLGKSFSIDEIEEIEERGGKSPKGVEIYKIGMNGTEIFLFSITINFGANLQLLLQDTISFLTQQQFPELDLSTLNHGYYFQYTVFESVITSNKFYDLSHPNINPETFTFRIQSSLEELKSFLIKESNVVINLYHDNQMIGFAEIPLTGLFDYKTGEPRSLDRVCPMYNSKRELPVSADVQTARIGVYLTISRDNSNENNDDVTPDSVERTKSFPIEHVKEKEQQQQIREQNNEHKYRVLIDLESIQLNWNIKNIYIRYSYPALGITNNKATQILSNDEGSKDISLINSTNTIEVMMTPQRLDKYFEAVPLLMEIWQSVDQKQSQIGVATLHLEEIFLSQPVIDDETRAEVKTFTTLAPIKSFGVSANSREMGHVSVSIRLDDYGEDNSTKSQSVTELSELAKELQPAKEEQEKEKDNVTTKSLADDENGDSSNNSEHISTFQSDLFRKAAEHMKYTQKVLAVKKKNVSGQSFSKFKVQQLKSIDLKLQQYILYFKTRDESLLRSEKDFERRWLELDRQFDQRTKELENRHSSVINDDFVKNLQQEVNDLKIQLNTTIREKDHYESQWLRSLQVLAGMHEKESEEALFWKGFREMDQCWWQVKRMAEEEMELIDYEKFTLDILKSEIDRLKSQSQSC
ncbi:19936_t:CDS:2 [Funneliformis geosporum]|uniref:14750_t:CDS:1 n=1 Tax=Funneliformis geosporum TaxID=1117311 RepID=A0A9W4WVK0_9GLOM|nr:14750_t:CDS:2 [Funneliformis geosporum]CAI2183678.1 19936_t:CDS:2 [Funneliformis geosporum]